MSKPLVTVDETIALLRKHVPSLPRGIEEDEYVAEAAQKITALVAECAEKAGGQPTTGRPFTPEQVDLLINVGIRVVPCGNAQAVFNDAADSARNCLQHLREGLGRLLSANADIEGLLRYQQPHEDRALDGGDLYLSDELPATEEQIAAEEARQEKLATFCPEDGFDVRVDEDGCCVQCGATATGAAITVLEERLVRLTVQNGKLRECNDSMREAMKNLREIVGMPAQGEGTVLEEVARRLRKTLLLESENRELREQLAALKGPK